jgi:hypothetical protein
LDCDSATSHASSCPASSTMIYAGKMDFHHYAASPTALRSEIMTYAGAPWWLTLYHIRLLSCKGVANF